MLPWVAIAFVVLVSCADGGPAEGPVPAQKRPVGLVGEYVVDIQRTFWPKDRKPRHSTRKVAVKIVASDYEKNSFTLSADQKFEFVYRMEREGKVLENVCRGTWTREGDKITFDTTHAGHKEMLGERHGKVEGDRISFDTGSEIPPTIHLVRR